MECADYPDNDYIVPGSQDKIIALTDMVAGGESDTVVFEAPEESGEYTYILRLIRYILPVWSSSL